jgi:undecaprenyl-diphosphatase
VEITYFQAILTGLIQGITELFPVSSLGHAVLIPAWIGGTWKEFTTNPDSPYLAFTVALHLASAFALFLIFRKRWFGLISGGLNSLRGKSNSHSKIFWRIVIGTIPVGALGFLFEHELRDLFARPEASAIFLTINGIILITAEKLTSKTSRSKPNEDEDSLLLERITIPAAVTIGFGQSLALFSGISRFGITMSAGMLRKLSHHVASDYAFLLALPVILGAGILKVPDLFQPENQHLAGPIIAGSIVSFFATYFSISFLVRWFKTNTLYPFAIYCLIFGALSIVRFSI